MFCLFTNRVCTYLCHIQGYIGGIRYSYLYGCVTEYVNTYSTRWLNTLPEPLKPFADKITNLFGSG